MPPRRSTRALRRILGGGLAVLIAAAPLAIGTVHPVSRLLVFSGCSLLLFLTLIERIWAGRPLTVTVPTVAFAVAVLSTALQLIPLPMSIVGRLSPAAHEIFGLLDTPTAHALTLEPAATLRELAKLAAYGAFFVAAVAYASRSARRRQLVFMVSGTATAAALIGLIQAVVGARRILFLYAPEAEWATLVRGTFVNPNHFGALLCLGAPCTLALAMREPRWRWAATLATFVINVAAMLTLQRASIAAVLIGQALTFSFDRTQLKRGGDWLRSRPATWGMLGIAIAAAVAVAAVTGRSQLTAVVDQTARIGEEIQSPLSKFHVWARSVDLIWSYPWTGIGRGSFEQAFTHVTDVGGVLRYQSIENMYLQVVVDLGVPIALLLFLLAGWSLILAARRLRDDPLALGALGAVLALAVHDAVDFSVELPGVALPALALLATLFGQRSIRDEDGRRRVRVRAAYLVVPFIVVAPVVLEQWAPSATDDATALGFSVRDASVSTAELIARGDDARKRHPADYFVRLVVAERLVRELHPASLSWLNEAMYLNPTHPLPHVMAAETLAATRHKTQALLEYRLAAGASDARRTVWPFVMARYPYVEDLLAATPDEVTALSLLAEWLAGRRSDWLDIVYRRMVVLEPTNRRALTALARLALARRDVRSATERVGTLLSVDRSTSALLLAARAQILAGELGAAAELLDSLSERSEEAFAVELELVSGAARAGRAEQSRARLDALEHWSLNRRARAQLHEARAELEHQAGNEHQYRWELEQRDRLIAP